MDIVADALTRLRNAAKLNEKEVVLPRSKTVHAIADILQREGFLSSVAVKEGGIEVTLAYDRGSPVICGLKRISKGGQRTYIKAIRLKPVLEGRGIGIITTSKGVMTTEDAQKLHLGGEYICEIW